MRWGASSVRIIVDKAAERLADAGIDSARLDARLLLGEVLGIEPMRVWLLDRELTGDEQQRLDALVERRVACEPMAYILGRQEFWSLDFAVDSHTLIPRPDSETLVEAVLATTPSHHAPRRVLDLGTGSGCLVLSLLSEYPEATGLGVDCSAGALAVADRNARNLGIHARVEWRLSNWTDGVAEKFDLVISNPPYIADGERGQLMADVRDYEPDGALFAGTDGLNAYRHILAGLAGCLEKHGHAAFEVGAGQADAVERLAMERGFTPIGRKKDLAGIDRVVLLSHANNKYGI